MPPNTATLRVGPYFLSLLLILVVGFGLVFLPGQRRTPKLGLDLEGGAQVTLQAQTPNGKRPNPAAMKVARQILENRVNARGVSAALVYQQSDNQIVIAVPGASSKDVARVGQAAKLNFRPVVFAAVANSTTSTTPTATPSASTGASAGTSGTATTGATTTAPKSSAPKASTSTSPKATTSPNKLLDANRLAPSTTPASTTSAAKTTAAKTSAATTTAAPTTSAAKTSADPFAGLGFTLPTSDTAFNALTAAQQTALSTALSKFDCTSKPADTANKPLVACDNNTPPQYKYFLGPVIVAGTEISSADAVAPSASGNTTWTVSINLKSKGQAAWADFTGKHHSDANTNPGGATSCSASTVPCADYVAFTLDGNVVTAPQTNGTINGTTQVSGTFTESYAKDLANDLKYGALPLNFTQLSQQDVSPTLGTSQLKAGLVAGGIGLILVVIYSFLYYRGLGFVTVASLLVSGALTYAALVILGRAIGFTLTLAGIAGFIVAVGITADSFVVLFERLKDEVHSGRSLRVAVPRAWTRARRTILSADTVSFIAAAVLYYFTVGDVRGFAFTLGLSTLLDLVVVFLFTHPLVSLLSRSRAFGSPRFTGLNSVRTGGIAPSPEGSARPAKARRTRAAGGATATGGSVALLEREDDHLDFDLDDDDDDDDDVAPVAATPAAPREPEIDSGAPRRSRVVPRSTPPAEIGADAAERAAARRGRAVRPPKPVVEEVAEPDEDDVEEDADSIETAEFDTVDTETDDAVDSADDADSPGDESADADSAEVEADTDDDTDTENFTDVEPASEPVITASRGGSSAAERAAARRRLPGRRRSSAVPPEPPSPATAEPAEPETTTASVDTSEEAVAETRAETVAETPAETESVEAVETPAEIEPVKTVPAAATTAGDGASARKATAVERAAARRARIRSRAGHPVESDDEDNS